MADWIAFRLPAGDYTKWSDVAASSLIDQRMKINVLDRSMSGTVTEAVVVDDGDGVEVKIELDPDWRAVGGGTDG